MVLKIDTKKLKEQEKPKIILSEEQIKHIKQREQMLEQIKEKSASLQRHFQPPEERFPMITYTMPPIPAQKISTEKNTTSKKFGNTLQIVGAVVTIICGVVSLYAVFL